MSLDPLTAAFDAGKLFIERFFPDKVEQAKQLTKLKEIAVGGDVAAINAHVSMMVGQMNINKIEAGHGSLWVAGWRPFIGWTGGAAMAYQFVLYPILMWVWVVAEMKGAIPEGVTVPPVLETGALFSIVMGMLGIGAQRSYDKKQGTDTKRIA